MPKIFEELVLLDENGDIVEPDSKPKKQAKTKRPKERKARIVVPKAKKKRGFAAADGKGLDEIREMVANEGYEIFKDKGKGGTGKFIFIDGDMNAAIIKHEGRIGLLYDAIYKFGIEKFLKNNTIETSTRQDLLDNKRIKIARAILKAQQKENQAEIDKLLEKKIEIALKIMNTKLVRRSPEHLALREQLHEVHDELKALGHEVGNQQVGLGHESMRLASVRAKALKKERKEKKQNKNKTVQIKGAQR